MTRNTSLDVKIASLVDGVGELRGELQGALSTLRHANNPINTMNGLSRTALILMKRVLTDGGQAAKWDSKSLFSCCEAANSAGLLPPEIYFNLGSVRTWANKADHASEQVALTTANAEAQLALLLEAVAWYFCEYERGPGLAFIYRVEEDAGAHYRPELEPASDSAFSGAWPAFAGECVGRDECLLDIRHRLAEKGALILVGGPGYGKTRLAWEFAEANKGAYPHGLFFANLTTLPAGTEGLSLALYLGQLMQTMTGAGGAGTLLVLDNGEHLAGAATDEIQKLQARLPHLHVLGTSRTALERLPRYTVTALAMPEEMDDEADLPDCETIGEYPAIELFVKRAQWVDPGFDLDDDNAEHVVAICRRLAGIPFAIELAAGFIHLRTEDILASLDDWLGGGAGEGDLVLTDVRHGTVDGCVRWSVNLLPADATREFLYRAAIFRGGFTLDAYQQVVPVPPDAPAPGQFWGGAIMDLSKHGLVSKGANGIYELPGPVRLFALNQLRARSEYPALRESYEAWLEAQDDLPVLHSIGKEHADKIHLAIANAEEALKVADGKEGTDPKRAAQARSRRAFYLMISGKMFQSSRLLMQALPHMTDRRRSEVLLGIGMVLYLKNEFEPALVHARQSAELAAQEGDIVVQALATCSQGVLEGFVVGPNPGSEHLLEVAIELSGRGGDPWATAYTHLSRATYFWQADRLAEAEVCYQEALRRFQSVGDKLLMVFALNSLGHLARVGGRHAQAAGHYLASMKLSQGLLFERGRCGCVLGTCGMALGLERDEEAVLFWGAARRQYSRLGVSMLPPIERCYGAKIEALRARVEAHDSEAYARLYAQGQRLTLPQAFDRARDFLQQFQKSERGSRSIPSGSPSKM